jgi:uncharacterized protein (TIGR02996 family)
LIEAVLDDLEDEEARSVYADWLEQRGDPRGEYLRLEAELARILHRMPALVELIDPLWVRTVSRRYAVRLNRMGDKIATIKTVRQVTGCGLREAVDMVEAAPTVLLNGVTRDVAEKVCDELVLLKNCQVEIIGRGKLERTRATVVMLESVVIDFRDDVIWIVQALTACKSQEAARIVDAVIAGQPEMLAAVLAPRAIREYVQGAAGKARMTLPA